MDGEQEEDLDTALDRSAHMWDCQASPWSSSPSSARRAVSLPAEAEQLSAAAAGDLDGRLSPGCVNR